MLINSKGSAEGLKDLGRVVDPRLGNFLHIEAHNL